MNRLIYAALLLSLAIGLTACQSHSGSREYVPGKGWILND
jgi:hypothetical protein